MTDILDQELPKEIEVKADVTPKKPQKKDIIQ